MPDYLSENELVRLARQAGITKQQARNVISAWKTKPQFQARILDEQLQPGDLVAYAPEGRVYESTKESETRLAPTVETHIRAEDVVLEDEGAFGLSLWQRAFGKD